MMQELLARSHCTHSIIGLYLHRAFGLGRGGPFATLLTIKSVCTVMMFTFLAWIRKEHCYMLYGVELYSIPPCQADYSDANKESQA
jgi:hypothetical protein